MLKKFNNVLVFAVGVFEFVAVAGLLFGNNNDNLEKHQMYPSYFITDFRTKSLLCTWLMTLGFLRVSWATGTKTVASWLCLIGTHATEAIMFWSFALHPSFNKRSLPLMEFIVELVQLKITNPFSTFVLLFVPFMVVYFTLCGPQLSKKKSSKKNA